MKIQYDFFINLNSFLPIRKTEYLPIYSNCVSFFVSLFPFM